MWPCVSRQAHQGFVYQRGGLKRVRCTFIPETSPRHRVQLTVEVRDPRRSFSLPSFRGLGGGGPHGKTLGYLSEMLSTASAGFLSLDEMRVLLL